MGAQKASSLAGHSGPAFSSRRGRNTKASMLVCSSVDRPKLVPSWSGRAKIIPTQQAAPMERVSHFSQSISELGARFAKFGWRSNQLPALRVEGSPDPQFHFHRHDAAVAWDTIWPCGLRAWGNQEHFGTSYPYSRGPGI